jgi:hypothetical protein
VEAQLRRFIAKRPCWQPNLIHPADFSPAILIAEGWGCSGGDSDVHSLALTEVDFSKVLFETCLKDGETSITGEEKLKRLVAGGNIRLDPRFGIALLQEQGHKTLERLCKERGITYLDFFGRILVRQGGSRYVLYLERDDIWWNWRVRRLDSDRGWRDRCLSVCLAS